MLLIYLILGSIMIFQSGTFWTAYKINKIENRPTARLLAWAVGLGLFGLYFLISMIGTVQ
jgi:hypothetical protein